jgi:hypothetical protein
MTIKHRDMIKPSDAVEQNYTIELQAANRVMKGCSRTVQSKIKSLRFSAFKANQWFVFVKVPLVKQPPTAELNEQLDLFR